MRAWGRLFRISLAPSAVADIAAGVVVAARVWPSGAHVYVLMLASLCVYHGGMALNDWADRAADRRIRPDRPIPSGGVKAAHALAVSIALLLVGPWMAWSACAASGLVLASVSIAAAFYDVVGRGPWRGPLLLAGCRAGNLGAGIAYGLTLRLDLGESIDSAEILAVSAIPAAYAGYVFFVSRLGRLEDLEKDEPLGVAPALCLGGASVALLALPVLAVLRIASAGVSSSQEAGVVVAGAAFVILWGAGPLLVRALRTREWRRLDVLRAMGLALRRLLVFTAGAALLSGAGPGWIVAVAILCGYPISYALRGVFPPS